MTLRWGVVVAAAALLMVVAAPASASPVLDVSLRTEDAPSAEVPDSSVVVAGEPTRACAAPAFARPIDHVNAPPLAATGIGSALQVAAIAAFAVAGFMAPRRRGTSGLVRPRPHGHENAQG